MPAKPGTRYEALEPLRQAVPERFGSYERQVAVGLAVRHDHGGLYISDVFQKELKMLGIQSSPSFVRQPEGNGCVERFFRTLKEQLLWIESFETVEQLRLALLQFKDRYNHQWIIERHGFLSPAEAHRRMTLDAELAA